jgi:3-hydroxy acid dehydrogenase/malonic semialdehyde reductase
VVRGFMRGTDQPPNISQQDIQDVINTNAIGLINVTQAVLPIMKKRPNGGQGDIIMMGSIAARETYVGGTLYCASKAAVHSFTDALRKELVDSRIRVIRIDPGQVETVSCS